MCDVEANKAFEPTVDAGSSTGSLPGDFPPGARRPDALPYRKPAQPPPTLVERITAVELGVEQARDTLQALHRDTAWLVEHWHQAIDRANEQLGDRGRRVISPAVHWVLSAATTAGLLYALAKGWF